MPSPSLRYVLALVALLSAIHWYRTRRLRSYAPRIAAGAAAASAAPVIAGRAQAADSVGWTYAALKTLVAHTPLPAAIVDLDAFDRNAQWFVDTARRHGKRIRLATKSVRVPYLIFRMLARYPSDVFGLMCFSVPEAQCLYEMAQREKSLEHRDVRNLSLMIAYPTVQLEDLQIAWRLTQAGANLSLMIDSIDHVRILEAFWAQKAEHDPQNTFKCRVCIDIDTAFRPVAGVHLGAHRSPLHDREGVQQVLMALQTAQHVQLAGVMGYEAHIAGLGDSNPFTGAMQWPIRFMQSLSMPAVMKWRAEVADMCRAAGFSLEYYNGGGSGNFEACCHDACVSEVTIGSGLLQSTLFDFYRANRCKPALFFALQCTRVFSPGHIICCQSGGFIASGAISQDKAPTVWCPAGLSTFADEGWGEVQTPMSIQPGSEADGARLAPGDPVFCRPAKAGELAERFTHYMIVEKQADIVCETPTYRGLGYVFH